MVLNYDSLIFRHNSATLAFTYFTSNESVA